MTARGRTLQDALRQFKAVDTGGHSLPEMQGQLAECNRRGAAHDAMRWHERILAVLVAKSGPAAAAQVRRPALLPTATPSRHRRLPPGGSGVAALPTGGRVRASASSRPDPTDTERQGVCGRGRVWGSWRCARAWR